MADKNRQGQIQTYRHRIFSFRHSKASTTATALQPSEQEHLTPGPAFPHRTLAEPPMQRAPLPNATRRTHQRFKFRTRHRSQCAARSAFLEHRHALTSHTQAGMCMVHALAPLQHPERSPPALQRPPWRARRQVRYAITPPLRMRCQRKGGKHA